MSRNLSPKEKKEWILENCIDEIGNVDLRYLDFSDFDGDIYTAYMKVKNGLYQYRQEVGKELYQDLQVVSGDLHQGYQEVEGMLRQDKLEE